jgi:hypothetical protein
MKKVLTIISLIVITLVTGCSIPTGKEIKIEYGTYKIDKLVKNAEHSTSAQTFYTLKEDKNKELPDNIGVSTGTNYYKKENHEEFKNAILQQLGMQSSLFDTLNSSGFTTEKGNIAYKFIMKNDKATATQYYIVGDNKFILIYETNYTGNPELDKETEYIVNTFEWNE